MTAGLVFACGCLDNDNAAPRGPARYSGELRSVLCADGQPQLVRLHLEESHCFAQYDLELEIAFDDLGALLRTKKGTKRLSSGAAQELSRALNAILTAEELSNRSIGTSTYVTTVQVECDGTVVEARLETDEQSDEALRSFARTAEPPRRPIATSRVHLLRDLTEALRDNIDQCEAL